MDPERGRAGERLPRTWTRPGMQGVLKDDGGNDTVVPPDKAQMVPTTQRHEPREHSDVGALREEVARNRNRFIGSTLRSMTLDLSGGSQDPPHATRPHHGERGVKAVRRAWFLVNDVPPTGGRFERITTRRAGWRVNQAVERREPTWPERGEILEPGRRRAWVDRAGERHRPMECRLRGARAP